MFYTPTTRWIPALGCYDGVVATSNFTVDAFSRANPSAAARVHVIYYGIRLWRAEPETKFRKDRERRFFRDRPFPIIGMVVELWKNQKELLEAARLIARAFPSVTVAVVAYKSGGDVEMLRERGGGLMNGGVEAFADAVVKLLRDVALCRRLGEEGRGIVQSRYTLERIGQAHLEYYRWLAGKGPPSPGSKPE